MEAISIRKARPEDIPELSELLVEICDFHCIGRPDIFKNGQKYNDKELDKLIKAEDRLTFVALDGENIIASAYCILKSRGGSVVKSARILYVDDLCVKKQYRSKGVGRLLFERIKETAREAGISTIELNVWEFEGSAVGFYEKMGMSTQRRIMELKLK